MNALLPFVLCYLLCLPVWGQASLSGRTVDDKAKHGLPGVTILQVGTSNGTSSDAEGNFTLSISNPQDSVTLVVSYVGYYSQQLRVGASNRPIVELKEDTRPLVDCVVVPWPMFALVSGIRYTPFGASVKVYHSRPGSGLFIATLGYQTNLQRNHVFTVNVNFPSLNRHSNFYLTEAADLQRLRILSTGTQFDSYTTTLGLHPYRIGNMLAPAFLVGGGYARFQPLGSSEQFASSGFGYSLGLRHDKRISFFRLYGFAQATRWPGYWQWQGYLKCPFGAGFEAGLAVNKLRHYSEVSLMLACSIQVRLNQLDTHQLITN